MIESLGRIDAPGAALTSLRSRAHGTCARLSFPISQYWLAGSPSIELHALCLVEGDDLLCVISDDGKSMTAALSPVTHVDRQALSKVAGTLNATVINLNRPLLLNTVRIEKPWGEEIWYTGVEQRGVCRVGRTPLPWLVGLAAEHCRGAASDELILLKILAPLAAPVYGDLYFEMHEQKVEVYVVTHVDESAWPGGAGAIRFGFDRHRLSEFESVDAFKQAWLDSVNAYREIRVEIDRLFDEFRAAQGIGHNDVIPPALGKQWNSRLDSALRAREEECRSAMNAFSQLHPIKPGDVVRVPPFTPHSLQHGVRVVEFQTPHYERYILSFAQKVLTQPHWDTVQAADKIHWHANFDTSLETIESGDSHRVDQVADFTAFEVRRLHLDAGTRYKMTLPTYAIVMAIEAPIDVCGIELAPEQACLVPAMMMEMEIAPARDAGCFALIAIAKAPG